jgi:hypothetical protein
MDYNYTLELYRSLQFELQKENAEDNLLGRLSNTIEKVRLKLNELENHIKADPFSSISEEILYFKKVCPMFTSQLIYYSESYNLERSLHLIDKMEWAAFLKEELKAIPAFFKKNSFLYEYHKLNLSELDAVYFSQQASSKSHLLLEFPAINFTAAATSSYTLAKIMALERLKTDITEKLDDLDTENHPVAKFKPGKNTMQWTGETINLVEVAYGIWLTGQVNNGTASITQIIAFLESRFNVKIGRPYRRWTEVARRKTVSPTKFIDQMKTAIEKRIDEENRLT